MSKEEGFVLKRRYFAGDYFSIYCGNQHLAHCPARDFLACYPDFKDVKKDESCPIDIIIKKRKSK